MDLESLKKVEDEIHKLVDSLPAYQQAILYKYLHSLGLRISQIEQDIRQGLKS